MMVTDVHGRHIEVNGVSLYVEEHGQGVPVVLVHGDTVSSRMWEAAVPLLAPHCRVITFDTRGHGHSTNPSGHLSYRLIADDTAALVDALALDRPFVGGWSGGGHVTVEFGMHYPHVARGLMMGGVQLDFQSDSARTSLREGFRLDAAFRPDFDRLERESPDWVAYLRLLHPNGEKQWRRIREQTIAMYLAYPDLTRDHVHPITTPSIVIHADRDDLPLDDALKLYRWLANAELAVLPGCDHSLAWQEPATFVAVVLDFIARHQDDADAPATDHFVHTPSDKF